jgi:ABC-type phosphate transport system substrate-binding protein
MNPRYFLLAILLALSGTSCPGVAEAGPPSATAGETGFVVIGNATGLQTCDRERARDIFRGGQTLWPTGESAKVVLPSARADFSEAFARGVLDLSRTAMQRYWLALVFQGRARPPVFLNTAGEMVAYVRTTPGAIAMVPAGTPGIPADLVIPARR